ncbi:unnamed protein product, partial [Linum tenue]
MDRRYLAAAAALAVVPVKEDGAEDPAWVIDRGSRLCCSRCSLILLEFTSPAGNAPMMHTPSLSVNRS